MTKAMHIDLFSEGVKAVVEPIPQGPRMWNPAPAKRALAHQVEARWLSKLQTHLPEEKE